MEFECIESTSFSGSSAYFRLYFTDALTPLYYIVTSARLDHDTNLICLWCSLQTYDAEEDEGDAGPTMKTAAQKKAEKKEREKKKKEAQREEARRKKLKDQAKSEDGGTEKKEEEKGEEAPKSAAATVPDQGLFFSKPYCRWGNKTLYLKNVKCSGELKKWLSQHCHTWDSLLFTMP